MRARRPNIISSRQQKPPRRGRLLLAFASLLLGLLGLEGMARVFNPAPAPLLFRDHVYINTLPLVNGDVSGIGELPTREVPLLPEKAPGEVRIFFFGESSTQGFPGGAEHSPVTLLQEQLKQKYPERTFTLVNLGRCGAVTRDGYYYLLYARRFQPDIVLFYMGTNDCCSMDGELCLPLERPRLHEVWRTAVEHSQALWLARAYLPQLLRSRVLGGGPTGGSRPPCDLTRALRRWTDLLIQTAASSGAKVLVSLPVYSLHAQIDYWERAQQSSRSADVWGTLTPEYTALLTCRLDPSCTFTPALEAYLAERYASGQGRRSDEFTALLDAAWTGAAQHNNVPVVNPRPVFQSRSADGRIGPPQILDNVHLSVDGAWTLAEQWLKALEPMLEPDGTPITGTPVAGTPVAGTPITGTPSPSTTPTGDLERARFIARVGEQGKRQLVEEGLRLLGRRHPFFALSYFEHALRLTQEAEARTARGEGAPCAVVAQSQAWKRLKERLPQLTARLEESVLTRPAHRVQTDEQRSAAARSAFQTLDAHLPGLARALARDDAFIRGALSGPTPTGTPGPAATPAPVAPSPVAAVAGPASAETLETGKNLPPGSRSPAQPLQAVYIDDLARLGIDWVRTRLRLPSSLPAELRAASASLDFQSPLTFTEDDYACLIPGGGAPAQGGMPAPPVLAPPGSPPKSEVPKSEVPTSEVPRSEAPKQEAPPQ